MTLITDLVDIPERVHSGDFVLQLTVGVTRPEETVANYVVTPQLVGCFDEALGLVRSAVETSSSKAAYLHGSFGSGKSHFMAILDLLLAGDPHARSIPELGPVVAKHNAWTEGRRFLLVPYHMIGATDMESAILGGYAEHVRRLHPDAPTPGVFRAAEIFRDARELRATMGDETFFARLNGTAGGPGAVGTGDAGGWGALAAGWNAATFEEAVDAPVRSEDRVRLVGDLVERFFTAQKGHKEFVGLDDGLAILSAHAKSLGYDALILFLDELILWLASHAADVSFVNREGQKLAKLVEAQRADRPAPIVSFVARQRDLKELIGDQITGAELTSFSDVLGWWEARFSKIVLEDRNLPVIAEKRVLRPKSEAARQILDDEFAKTARIREEVIDVLQTRQGDREMFRKLYPFSPALVDTLVAVSFALQRERTALKVMLQLLVEGRDRLRVGEIIPVGDLFDVVAEGNDAFSDAIKVHFDNAKKLYQTKLRPILERDHGLRFEDAASLPPDDPRAAALRNDDRLIKTLLLSALAPNVESLKGLTASRLAALNWGTIKSPIPGREGQMVLQKCRKWASEVGQIKVGDDPTNPAISVQLTGVDTDAIVQQARTEDNRGNRIRKIKELLFRQLGIEQRDELFQRHDFTWRATKRSCDVMMANVRELTDDAMRAEGEDWKVIVDFPFDPEPNRGPADDLSRVEAFQRESDRPSRTLVWVPSFLSLQAQRELGTLVILDHVLHPERYKSYVTHLSEVDRSAARSLLENQRSQLEQRMIAYLQGAYGVLQTPPAGSIDPAHELELAQHFKSLDTSFDVRPPVAADFKQALDQLLDQALRFQYPAHPQFDEETKLTPAVLKKVWAVVERATQAPDGRLAVETDQRRDVRRIANPVRIGEMAETHFVLGHHWPAHFNRKEAEHGGPMTVARLRQWMDEPQPMGLPREVQNLVIMAFAAQTNRSFLRHGGPVVPSVDGLADDLELREQALPSKDDWSAAVKRAAAMFGVAAPDLLSATSVAKLASEVKAIAAERRASCAALVERLAAALPRVGLDPASSQRLATAAATRDLVDRIASAEGQAVVEALARAEIASSPEAMGSSLKKAADVVAALEGAGWNLIEAVKDLPGDAGAAAEGIRRDLQSALGNDEIAVALAPAVKQATDRATRLLASVAKAQAPAGGAAAPAAAARPAAHKVVARGEREGLTAEDLDAVAAEIREHLKGGARLKIVWEVYEP